MLGFVMELGIDIDLDTQALSLCMRILENAGPLLRPNLCSVYSI